MLQKDQETGKLMEVLAVQDRQSPLHPRVVGRLNDGEESQERAYFGKDQPRFASGEPLPRCWTDPYYRDDELEASHRSEANA